MSEVIDDKWIGIEAAAEYLDVNKDSIRNWIKKEFGIPAHKIGKQWKGKNKGKLICDKSSVFKGWQRI